MRKMTRFAALLLTLALLACLAVPAAAADSAPPMDKTFEAAFKSWKGEWAGGGCSPVKMKLEGDTLTFDYSPVFFFDKSFGLTEAGKARIVEECVWGFQGWEGVYPLYGREITVKVDVHPTTTEKKLSSSVRVIPRKNIGSSWVPGCVLWRRNSPLLTMYLRVSNPDYAGFEHSAMHEFGHVLGLFDAYGYGAQLGTILGIDLHPLGDRLLPEAPLDRAPEDALMRSRWEIYPTDIAMLLYAWKNNRLQLYTKSVLTWLGAQVSPAFSQ